MNIVNKIKLLKQVDLFRFFKASALRKLCENCTESTLKAGDILIQEGSLDNTMYLILSGKLGVYKGIKKIAVLGPGKILGEMSLIESKPRSATIKALSDALLMEIDENHFDRYIASKSQALVAMLKTLSSRIRSDLDLMSNDMQKLNFFIHDMNNFLSLMEMGVIYLDSLLADIMNNGGVRLSKKALERGEKALRLFNGSKDGLRMLISQSLNQAHHNRIDYHKGKFRMVPLVHETIQELSSHEKLKGKHIKVTTQEEVTESLFNYLDIKRVLQNLLINAGFATKDKGTIEVKVKKRKGHVIVSVIDEGPGIPEAVKPFLFKYPISTKKDSNGLGLLSCKEIIENHHQGKFWFESGKKKGTAFHFMIPVQKPSSSV